jgi:hypothetical protein
MRTKLCHLRLCVLFLLGCLLWQASAMDANGPMDADDPVKAQGIARRIGLPLRGISEGSLDYKVTVAVIDGGFDLDHQDLRSKIVPGYNARDCKQGALLSKIANSEDDNYGKTTSHGTHVAAIVTQLGGEAVDCLFPIKVGAEGNSPRQAFYNAMAYAAKDPNIKIVNISYHLGDDFGMFCALKELALADKLICLIAGNQRSDANPHATLPYWISLAIQDPAVGGRIIVVGATYYDDTAGERLQHFSNIAFPGLAPFFITAPGTIESAVPKDHEASGRKIYSGTSMAAPIVAAVAARLWSEFPLAYAHQISLALREGASKVDKLGVPYSSVGFGAGFLNYERSKAILKERYPQYKKNLPIEYCSAFERREICSRLLALTHEMVGLQEKRASSREGDDLEEIKAAINIYKDLIRFLEIRISYMEKALPLLWDLGMQKWFVMDDLQNGQNRPCVGSHFASIFSCQSKIEKLQEEQAQALSDILAYSIESWRRDPNYFF